MRRPVLPLLVLLPLLFLFSCSDDSTGPSGGADPEYEVVAEADVGTGGGTVGDDGVEVTVPAGAFAQEVTLTLSASTDDRPFGDDGDDVTYRLDGVPSDFSGALTITLRPESGVAAEPYVGLGRSALVTSLGDERVGYRVVTPAAEGDSLLSFELEPPTTEGKDEPSVISVVFSYLAGYDTYFSEHNYFQVAFPSGVTANQAAEVGVMLEDCYDLLGEDAGIGFSYANRTRWPIMVTIKELSPTVYGYAYSLPDDYNAGWLELNTLKLSDAANLRRTAGHEFFHLVQSWYYPEYTWTIWKYMWLDEACSVWSEALISGDDTYVSLIREGNEYEPFQGLANTATSGAQNHGYGMSAAVKYLADLYGDAVVESFYDGVLADEAPADCMLDAAGAYATPAVWWPEFLTAYCENTVYTDMPPADLAASLVTSSRRFKIEAASDTLKTFTNTYMDLSARMFRVDLDKAQWSDDEELVFSLDGDDGHGDLSIWSYGAGGLARLVGPVAGTQTVDGLQARHDANQDLLILVTNTRAVAPYQSTTDITLEVRLQAPQEILGADEVSCWSELIIARDTNTGPTSWSTSNITIVDGAFTGYTYIGTDVNALGDRDSIRAVIDPERMVLTEFQVFEWAANNSTDVPILRLEGSGEIALVKDQSNRYVARVEAAAACAVVDHISGYYDPYMNEYWYSLQSCTCDEDSYIELRFYF